MDATQKAKLTNLDFNFIHEIHKGVYIVKYARNVADGESKKAHVVDDRHVCFFTPENADHACCIPLRRILFPSV